MLMVYRGTANSYLRKFIKKPLLNSANRCACAGQSCQGVGAGRRDLCILKQSFAPLLQFSVTFNSLRILNSTKTWHILKFQSLVAWSDGSEQYNNHHNLRLHHFCTPQRNFTLMCSYSTFPLPKWIIADLQLPSMDLIFRTFCVNGIIATML